jgi:3-hydroxybutyrate dehydrogenase
MSNKKTVVITGGTSGIGLGTAREFAKAGYNVVLNGLEANGAEITAKLGEEFGIQTHFSPANMLKSEQIYAFLTEVEQKFGAIDVMINSAGVQYVAPIEEFPAEKWDFVIGVNLTAAFHTSKAVWSGMKSRKWGRIIFIASAHALQASEYKSAYVTSKHGILGLTKVLALEGAPYGITVNAICPGYVLTPLVENQIPDQMKAHNMTREEVINKVMLYKQPIKEFVTTEALGQLALFLASDYARMITGAALPMEGGWSAQ